MNAAGRDATRRCGRRGSRGLASSTRVPVASSLRRSRSISGIAAGGGVSVIIGAVIVGFGMYRLGKIIIALGAGMGLIGFIIFITGSIINGSIVNDLNAIIFEIINA